MKQHVVLHTICMTIVVLVGNQMEDAERSSLHAELDSGRLQCAVTHDFRTGLVRAWQAEQ